MHTDVAVEDAPITNSLPAVIVCFRIYTAILLLQRIQAKMAGRNIIVLGASAGGFEAIQKVVAGLPETLSAALFITLHLSARSEGILPEVLQRLSPLPVAHPWEETVIEMGHIYVAPPDYHLILTRDSVTVGHGPKENMQRPCINTMFRSAAASHGERVTGVLLTGLLDDGAAGLWEIQQQGGATVVQDPNEAAYSSMPESAIRGLNVQYILRLAEIAPLLARLAVRDGVEIGQTLRGVGAIDETVSQSCPECHGVMKLHRFGTIHEYRCHVGHRFGLQTMIAEKTGVVERTLWAALAQSEELVTLLVEAKDGLDQDTAAWIDVEIGQRKEEQHTLKSVLDRARPTSI